MKSLLIGTILAALLWPTVAGAQPPTSPFSRQSLNATAAALARTSEQGPQVPSDWAEVKHLAPGTGIVLLRRSAPPVQGRILSADNTTITVLNVERVEPRSFATRLEALASSAPKRLASIPSGGNYKSGDVRITSEKRVPTRQKDPRDQRDHSALLSR